LSSKIDLQTGYTEGWIPLYDGDFVIELGEPKGESGAGDAAATD